MEKVKTYTQIDTTVTPVGPRILVKPDPARDKTATGIFVPGEALVKPNSGVVVAVGTPIGERLIYCTPGDRILFNQGCGGEVMHKNEKHILMWAADQVGRIDNVEPVKEEEDGK